MDVKVIGHRILKIGSRILKWSIYYGDIGMVKLLFDAGVELGRFINMSAVKPNIKKYLEEKLKLI